MQTTKANIQIHANCGCGFDSRPADVDYHFESSKYQDVLEAAIQHAEQTSHTLQVLGMIHGMKIKTQTVVIPTKWSKKERVNGKE